MFTTKKCKLKTGSSSAFNSVHSLFIATTIGLSLLGAAPAFADNAVNLRALVISTGDETQDGGLAYIKPVLEEMRVPYDVLNASTQGLTAATLSPGGCEAATAGCVGNYNGIIVTNADLGGAFTPSEWDILHAYETSFKVNEAVLSGWPGTYWDPNAPWGIYLDYGLTPTSGGTYTAHWAVPDADKKAVFEYVNQANPLPITEWAFAALPRNDAVGPRDGTVPSVVPLLKTQNDEALVSVIRYMKDGLAQRQVLFSSITNAWFAIHSQALAYEFVNWATQGVFVGGRFVHMAAHLDDLFIPDELWDPITNQNSPLDTYRLTSDDISSAIAQQTAFRAAHPTAGNFKLDFPFNGAGAVVDPLATTLTANMTDDLVLAVVNNKTEFRYINHTFTHADMDKAPPKGTTSCDYDTLNKASLIKAEITKNRTVWGLLGLPERAANNRILVSGNHSGLKDRKCTDIPELHPEMLDVQSDDVQFSAGANPLFFQAAASAGVDYLASDSSQPNQAVEQYVTNAMVNDGSNQDRIMLPRYPANLFYNVIEPAQWVDEYNYIFNERFINAGKDPCAIPGAICAPRDYAEILAAEADTALRHMLSYKKWPHFFHQSNLAEYEAGKSLQFDWLNAVYTEYEKLFTLPVKNYPYYLIGDKTQEDLAAKSATIQATWDRTSNTVTLSADKVVPNLLVTGLTGGGLYGGQLIREVNVSTNPIAVTVNQALNE